MTVAVLGCGRLGTALARALLQHGYAVIGWTRSAASARRAKRCGVPCTSGALPDLGSAAIIFLTVPDPAVAPFAARVRPLVSPGAILVHCSARLDRTGVDGSLHPLCTVPDGRVDLTGVACALDGTLPALRALTPVARKLGLHAIRIAPRHRTRYHAGAVLGAGGLVALVAAATDLLAAAGLGHAKARAAILPLLRSTLAALERDRKKWPLTGPVARGDAQAVQAHLQALPPSIRDLYRALSRAQLELAKKQKMATFKALREIRKTLARS